MSLIVSKKHSTANDILEGQHVFNVADSATPTVPLYQIALVKDSSGKLVLAVFDTRVSENPNKIYVSKGADYATNLGLPADLIALLHATGTNGSILPAGSGAVAIAKANLTNIGDSTITTDVMLSTVTGSTGGSGSGGSGSGGSGSGGSGSGGSGSGGSGSGKEEQGGGSGDDSKNDDSKKLSTGWIVGIALAVLAVIGGALAYFKKNKED